MSEQGRRSDRQNRLPATVLMAGILAVGVVVGPLTACDWRAEQPARAATASAEPTSAASPPPASPTRLEAPARLSPAPQAADPAPDPLVSLATADAARQTGADPGQVRIVLVEARVWPDRSLGCPRPGMGYAQAITPGFLIVVEARGRRLDYHTDHAQVVLCAS